MAKREMKTTKTEETIDEMVISNVDEVVEETEEVTPKTLLGVVTGCLKLNVRKKANIKADVVSVVDAKSEATVYPDDSTKDWYKVTVNGIDGFCMKKFVSIKD